MDPLTEGQSLPEFFGRVPQEFLKALCGAYADLVKRQRTTGSAFVNWTTQTSRSHEFSWIGGAESKEVLISQGGTMRVGSTSPLYAAVQKMQATAKLNPYEREVLYGYPYVIGRLGGQSLRGPLFTIPVTIEPEGASFVVQVAEETVRFNTLVFRTEGDTAAREQALEDLLQETPSFPLHASALQRFFDVMARGLPDVAITPNFQPGNLQAPPSEPRSNTRLTVVPQAALFVAPKSSYFLTKDLETLSEQARAEQTALEALLATSGDDAQVDIAAGEEDRRRIFYPFPSNRSQRRVAMLVDDETTRCIRIDGPPGTGKSLTIANLVCHLVATGRSVLVCSQKDKALQVVDQKLRSLDLPELPMTLLHFDRESKEDLRVRLDSIQKERPTTEVRADSEGAANEFGLLKSQYSILSEQFEQALEGEAELVQADRDLAAASGLPRFWRQIRRWSTHRRVTRKSPASSDEVAELASELREQLLEQALLALGLGAELRTAQATREQKQRLREFSKLLQRNQTSVKNFTVFDQMKKDPTRTQLLLKSLPAWIMNPDDVARLFPCEPGLFDVVIVDEASQVDLPSILPVVYRGQKVVVAGDLKQMQARRFAFTAGAIADEAWRRHKVIEHDPDGFFQPLKQSLLDLSAVRSEEDVLLDEHFRCLPPIIEFSNERWYGGRLRVMTDERRKRFGPPDQPIIELHHVADGEVREGGQENQREAAALVAKLTKLLNHPAYAGATFGVICLFDDQVALARDLVTEQVGQELWERHQLVVVNPDGFQGDERDVILYSLSYDANQMSKAAIAARMSADTYVQGMLNVAFTRARDEIHIFHTAPIDSFCFGDGRPSALSGWLEHCRTVQGRGRQAAPNAKLGRADSQFEVEVAEALTSRGYDVIAQYPACGFNIDLVVSLNGARLAVECDGELFHNDVHGQLRTEDLERQAILERAGWDLLRIAYRNWRRNREAELDRIDAWFSSSDEDEDYDADAAFEDLTEPAAPVQSKNGQLRLSDVEAKILEVVGHEHDEERVLKLVREGLGYRALGKNIRALIMQGADLLSHKSLLVREDGDWFPTSKVKESGQIVVTHKLAQPTARKRSHRGYGRSGSYYRRRW